MGTVSNGFVMDICTEQIKARGKCVDVSVDETGRQDAEEDIKLHDMRNMLKTISVGHKPV